MASSPAISSAPISGAPLPPPNPAAQKPGGTPAQRTTRYKTGDELAGGTIALIDYRRLPSPTQPGLLSDSRVILRIGSDLYAVERGRTLADIRKLDPSEIPDLLTRNP